MRRSLRRAALPAVLAAVALGLLATPATPAVAQGTVTVPVGDIFFCDPSFQGGVCDTTITAGDTIVWDFSGASLPHTTTECGASCDAPSGSPLWDSGIVDDGSTFQYTFDEPGTYLYYCFVHPTIQRGRITVEEAEVEPTPAQPTPEDGDGTATDGGAQPSAVPATGDGAAIESSSGSRWLLLASLGAAGVALSAMSVFASRRAR